MASYPLGLAMVGGAMDEPETLRHAIARRFEQHRAWAIRLFPLAIGSWRYRMNYGFWLLFTGRLGHTPTFDGWFDLL